MVVVVKGVISVLLLLVVVPSMFPWNSGSNGRGGAGGFLFVAGGSGGGIVGGRGGGFWSTVAPSNVGIAVAVTAMAGLALVATVVYSRRGSLKSPWSLRKRKHALLPQQWKNLFDLDGKLCDGGVKFLKKVRSGGVDPTIRAEVWPFLLGLYDLTSTQEERDSIRIQKRKEYEKLRKQCRRLLKRINECAKLKGTNSNGDCGTVVQETGSPASKDVICTRESLSTEKESLESEDSNHQVHDQSPDCPYSDDNQSGITSVDASIVDTESSDSDSIEEPESMQTSAAIEGSDENDPDVPTKEESSPFKVSGSTVHRDEDFETWQRIIRLDAVRTNAEWIVYSPTQAAVSEERARCLAEAVGLKDYDHLEPCRVFHAARLVAILEAYALYDAEIGYCQGMSDLLSPIVAIIEEDFVAFWCFVGFMKKARHNFRLDEVGIRRQLNIVSKIIKFKDSHFYRHLEKLQAEDCFFVYRMVVVLFRRELTFEQTVCLWEVMWADQAAIRAGIGNTAWGRIRQKAPPTDDLLLYAIAACVLQRRKLIIETYSSMDEIIRECNSMAGHLDVWKLLNDAHDLVVNLHDKI
ncbi:Rab-GTPase-TBC domain [Macleaya cordata]|uniref:Rab-GTPase-TBC domain n=1 Tax=Macleaya cordata TaxID=56857 RepID=A0A200QWD4_MACCD|nr:Rab-GTPase-TBC domain [Macleaya cordata]